MPKEEWEKKVFFELVKLLSEMYTDVLVSRNFF